MQYVDDKLGLNDSCTQREQRTKGHEASMRALYIIDRVENASGDSTQSFAFAVIENR
jgi:hypothetical protein